MLFWDVDTQHDFMDEDGKLPVPDAQAIVAKLAKITQFAAQRRIPILATADAHPIGDPEFLQFGEHCVPGTYGQKKIEETLPAGTEVVKSDVFAEQVCRLLAHEIPQLVIEKRVLDVFDEPLADKVLAELRPDNIFLYGVATEYCVRCETLSLRKRGYDVTILTDAIKPIVEDAGEKAIAEMQAAGARTADTETVLKLLARKAGRK
jgi:nicotinamidase/pyrazinamidase